MQFYANEKQNNHVMSLEAKQRIFFQPRFILARTWRRNIINDSSPDPPITNVNRNHVYDFPI